jgi:hypothetical protein
MRALTLLGKDVAEEAPAAAPLFQSEGPRQDPVTVRASPLEPFSSFAPPPPNPCAGAPRARGGAHVSRPAGGANACRVRETAV